jgi:AraC-like DNA-binding protein
MPPNAAESEGHAQIKKISIISYLRAAFYIKMKALFIIILSLFSGVLAAQENPFMQMAGKKYAEYALDWEKKNIYFFNLKDTIEAQNIVNQVKEAANKSGSMEWKLYAAYYELQLFEKMQYVLYKKLMFDFEESLTERLKILEDAQKYNVVHLQLLLRQQIIDYYWYELNNYELAFEQYAIQKKILEKLSLEEMPDKLTYLLDAGNAHYYFKDYRNAMHYYEEILAEKDNALSQAPKSQARNSLGLCYRYAFNDLEHSDSCFRLIVKPGNMLQADEKHRNVWTGISEGNLGYNMMLRGEYDKAIPLFKSSMEKTLKDGDLGYSALIAISLANVYLKKGNVAEAKHFIDQAKDYYNKDYRDGMLSRIYETTSQYYALTGNVKLSLLYMDSLLAENKRMEAQFNALQMLRVEQKQNLSEQKLKEEQLNTEKIKSNLYKKGLIRTVFAALFIILLLVRYLVLYRKKKAAYQELVRKSQEWAQIDNNITSFVPITSDDLQEEGAKQNVAPDEVDFMLLKDIEKLMLENKLYRNTELSVDLVAQELGVKKHYVPFAINHCANKSFNTFVNEYRIKEAIQLLSDSNAHKETIDSIAFDVGFTDCYNFYRVFKKMTGLSPTEFRRVIND